MQWLKLWKINALSTLFNEMKTEGKIPKNLKALDTQANCGIEVKQDREIWVTFGY